MRSFFRRVLLFNPKIVAARDWLPRVYSMSVVKSGASIVCTISLSKGVGSCTLTAKRLIPLPHGYHLVAVYLGNGNYLPSASAAKALTVFTPVD